MEPMIITGGAIRASAYAPVAEALLVNGSEIGAIGSLDSVRSQAGSRIREIDVDGRTVIPGLIESHVHPIFFGMTRNSTDCRSPVRESIADIVEALRADLAEMKPGGWLRGWGYDDTLLADGRHPNRDDLDRVSTEVPILISHISGHFAVANSKALEVAHVDNDIADVADGSFIRDAEGNLTGLLWEMGAVHRVQEAVPQPQPEDLAAAAEYAMQVAASRGMTSLNDMGTGVFGGAGEFSVWKKLAEDGRMPVRVVSYVAQTHLSSVLGQAPDIFMQGPIGRLETVGAKIWSDGSIQGLSAALHAPYSCAQESCGDLNFSGDELADMILEVDEYGGQCAVHANGDRAIDTVIDAFERVYYRSRRKEQRHRIEHLQMASTHAVARMAQQGSVASIFANHVRYWGDRHRDIFIGEDRAERIDPAADAVGAGLHFGMHSDCPITPMDSLDTFRTSVTRVTSSGKVLGAAQALSRRDALHSLTADSAYLTHHEGRRGRLFPGMDADITILDEDPITVSPEHDFSVEATIVDGDFVYDGAGIAS